MVVVLGGVSGVDSLGGFGWACLAVGFGFNAKDGGGGKVF